MTIKYYFIYANSGWHAGGAETDTDTELTGREKGREEPRAGLRMTKGGIN